MDSITVPTESGDVSLSVDALRSALPEGTGLYGGDFGAPDGFLSQDALKDRLKRHESTVLKSGGYLKPEDAYADDRLRDVLIQRGFDLEEGSLKPIAKLDADQAARMKAAWEADNLTPLAAERDGLAKTVNTLRRENVSAKAQAALVSELAPEAFKAPLPGVPSTLDNIIQHGVKFDDDGRAFFQVGEDMIPEPDVAKGILAYVGKHAKDLLAKKSQNGPGPGGGFSGGGQEVYSPERIAELSKKPAEYAKHRDRILAQQAGR